VSSRLIAQARVGAVSTGGDPAAVERFFALFPLPAEERVKECEPRPERPWTEPGTARP
jgi:hypothetical protein